MCSGYGTGMHRVEDGLMRRGMGIRMPGKKAEPESLPENFVELCLQVAGEIWPERGAVIVVFFAGML